jgi:hypothetical protein
MTKTAKEVKKVWQNLEVWQKFSNFATQTRKKSEIC